MSYAGCVTPFKRGKPRNSLLVHAYGHEVTGLKTYRSPKRKDQLDVCSRRGIFQRCSRPLGFMAHVLGDNRLHTIAASRCY